MKKSIKIGVSGDQGSFSEEAGMQYAESRRLDFVLDYLIDMDTVLFQLQQQTIDVGIFPVVNKRGGLVRMAFDAMGKYEFEMIDELWLPVRHCLMAQSDVSKKDITQVVSHAQGLLQCRDYLDAHFKTAKQIEWQDTAKAARDLREGLLPKTSAIIAPKRAALLFGLTLLAEDIHDEKPNLTAFIVVKNR